MNGSLLRARELVPLRVTLEHSFLSVLRGGELKRIKYYDVGLFVDLHKYTVHTKIPMGTSPGTAEMKRSQTIGVSLEL